jgi:hypothetical protein
LHDVLAWLEEDPEYVERALQFGLEHVKEEFLAQAMDFEIEKVFRLEPPALRNDYQAGETTIYEHAFLGLIKNYHCKSEEEFLEWQLRRYVFAVKAR